MDDVKVYLRDIRSKEWMSYTPGAWIPQYYARIEDALCVHRDTVGGSIGLTGTPERGRLTVCDVDGAVIYDFDWRTQAVETVAAPQGRAWGG
jgi:hypothetical protein